MSGFGQTGPYGKKGGFDIIAQGMSGIMMMTGYPGGRPAKVGIAMNDIASGVTALYGILGAYIGGCATARGSTSKLRCWKRASPGRIWEFGAYFGCGEIADRDGHPPSPLGALSGLPLQGRLRDGGRQQRQALAQLLHHGRATSRNG